MKVTSNQIANLKPCADGYKWYLKNLSTTEDLLEVLLKTNEYRSDWSRWLFTRLMTVKQKRMVAVFAAEQVLPIFERKYPDDKRPHEAIEAAKKVIEDPSDKNRKAAATYAAAQAAAHAADAAYAADAADAAYAAAYATYAATYAAAQAATYAAAHAADAADADARKEMQERIIHEAVRILDKEKE